MRGVFAKRVFVVPLFISEGYFTQEVIPRELGLPRKSSGEYERVLKVCSPGFSRSGNPSIGAIHPVAPAEAGTTNLATEQVIYYTNPIGTHESMTRVLLSRAREIVRKHPFPAMPKPKETALFIAGHGTESNENSRQAIERQVELIRASGEFAEVHPVFMEEEPRIANCYEMASVKNLVVVPFFISDGLHSHEDIPVMLGEPERVVQERLKSGQPTWRNPTERRGKRLWYSASIGNEPLIADVILERVCEAAQMMRDA